MYLAFLLITM